MTEIAALFAGVPVRDFEAGHAWYARLFGRPADVIVTSDEVMWRFADVAWLYVVRDEKRAGHALVALRVTDLDQTLADLADRGISGGEVEAVGGSGRRAVIIDADGNAISFIEVREELHD